MSVAPPNFEKRLAKYLEDIQQPNSEAGKAFLFLEFSREVFRQISADYAEKLFPVLEKHLTTGARTLVVKGRIDAYLGNLIIEFKKVLETKSQAEAESELKRYVSILWTQQGDHRVSYIVIATDGTRFASYRPRTDVEEGDLKPADVSLDQIDKLDLSKTKPGSAFVWLDRYMIAEGLQPATTQAFSGEFGLNKPAFKDAESALKQAWKEDGEQVLYEQWASFLRIVYGSKVDSEDLFIRHTYLATLAKLLAYSSFSGGALPVSSEQIAEILEGKVFEKWNIHNFLEEDFFSWVARSTLGVKATSLLLERLSSFDLAAIDEDILKALYQELVDPQARHDLGEYYTPDWLAELMVERVIGDDDAEKSVIDPACGSGTFLAATIRRKKALLKKKRPASRLQTILASVKGVDVHPLAVILSRTNFLASLGTELLSARRGPVSVPVYMADSIRLPESDIAVYAGVKSFRIEAEKKPLRLPLSIAEDLNLTDRVVEAMKHYAQEVSLGMKPNIQEFQNLLSLMAGDEVGGPEAKVLLDTAVQMAELIRLKKDTVWAFILKNIYKPLFLRDQKFDVVIGNPPWLSYRYVESVDYQSFLKNLILKEYKLLGSERAELITQMELATLFFARASDLYLADNGTISLVMPRSLFVADQHFSFRSGAFSPKMSMSEMLDLEDVDPLFRVPSCVITAQKGMNKYPVNVVVFEGRLPQRNTRWVDAEKLLGQKKKLFVCYKIGQRSFLESQEFGKVLEAVEEGQRSPYYEEFRQGATVVPHSVWFVDLDVHPRLGVDPTKPRLKTSQEAIKGAKEPYKDVRMEGEVESRFIFQVATGSEIAPFCHTELQIAVLPIEPEGDVYSLVRLDEAQRRGYLGLKKWLEDAEAVWKAKRGEKALKVDILSWLDYSGKLTAQDPRAKYRVLYNKSGTYLVSCVVENAKKSVRFGSADIAVSGTCADDTVYRFDTDNLDEAMFMSGLLNAPIIDALLKPMQSRGQFGPRDIHKKVLELPLPKFNPRDSDHLELVRLAKVAQTKAKEAVATLQSRYSGIGKIRQLVKVEIQPEILKIDKIARELLSKSGTPNSGLDRFA